MIPQFEPLIFSEYADVVRNQVLTTWVGPGKRVIEFEQEFAKYVGSKHAIAVSSGTAALMVALYATCDTDEVVVLPNYSFVAALNAARFLGMKYTILDISYDSMCLDITNIEEYVDTESVGAVIFINHNGYVGPELLRVQEFCEEKGILLIEDAACALGQWFTGKHAGTFGDIGCFSFSVPKLITCGQGGMIVTDNDIIANMCREVRDHGSTTWRQDGNHFDIGVNFKFNDILASFGLAQLNRLKTLLLMRWTNYKYLRDAGLDLHYYPTDKNTGPWMNVLRGCDPPALQEALRKEGIQSKIYYKPLNLAIGEGYSESYPETTKVYKNTLYLPSSLTLTPDQLDKIIDVVKRNT